MFRRFSVTAIPLLALLAACAGERRAPAPAQPRQTPFTSQSARQCLAALSEAKVRYTPLPDQHFGGGCKAVDSVKLLDIGLPTTNLGAVTCPLARNFAAWARHAVVPAGQQILGSPVVRIETFGTYSCRNVNAAATGNLSQHAFANAIDVSAFVLADGRRVSVLGGWSGTPEQQRFLRVLKSSACKRFATVLSPEYNRQHANHFHFDMSPRNAGYGGYCR